ncbi:MAG: bifunctional lysylphosphatidylglycerol flippase/synthetase MprF, partial [Acetobacteraceae bacterium]|nr:bifunctional lysylphosphatidylglycerol flippase/synthetase MprF [Acetobacteraceae bacterium]
MFGGALYLLYHQVAAYDSEDVRKALSSLSWQRIIAALGLTAASYFLLIFYDALALRHMRKKLPFYRIGLASFTSYAFTHSFGFGSLMHATIRYRFYAPLGLRTVDIAEITAFVNITFMIGLAIMFPVIALLHATALAGTGLPQATGFAFGAGALALAIGYAALGWWVQRVELFGFVLKVPGPITTFAQIGLSLADLALAGAAFFMCLPDPAATSYPHVLAVFVVALTAGIISHVPGGLGVFETIILVGLSNEVTGDKILAAVLVFRVIYFLVPLVVASALFGCLEAIQNRRRITRVSQNLAGWLAPAAPSVLAGCTFIAGAVLLFSNATPESGMRLQLVSSVLRLPIIETSHFIGSVVGVFLLLLSSVLQRRSRAAWLIALVLLLLGSIAELLNGLEWEQAMLLLLFCFILLASRGEFYRRSALVAEPFTPARFLAVGVVLGSALWLGLFSYKQVDYGDELWWQFALYGDASRFLRASVAVAVIALAAAALRLLASAAVQSGVADRNALTRAAEVVAQSPEARANLALLGDKRILFHPAGDGFVMFGIVRRSWVVLGDPIGPFTRWRDVLCQLATEATSHGGWPVFFGVGEAAAQICSRLGFAVRRIGDQAIVPLDQFAIEKLGSELQEAHCKIASLGCQFEVVEAECVPRLIAKLLPISEDWLRGNPRQRAFPDTAFHVDYLERFPAAIVRSGGHILAFASLVGSAGKAELSIEFVRHVATAPTGIVDFVLIEAILWAKGQAYQTVNLGLAPPRGLGRRDTTSRWERFGAYLYRHGEHYSDFN